MVEKENEEKLRKYKKLINFYKIDFLPSFKDLNKTNSELFSEIFFKAFENQESIAINDINYEKISMDSNHFFGCLHRTSSIDILTEIKSKSNISIEQEDMFLESSTYFYIDFINMGISAIRTQKIPSPDELIETFITRKSNLNLEIVPFKKDKKEIKDLVINSISMKFCDSNFVELKNIDKSDCEFSEYTFNAKLKRVTSSFIPKLISSISNDSSIKKLSVGTDSEEIDLIKNIFTKKVAIELTKNYKNDIDKIKQTLLDELLKIINT